MNLIEMIMSFIFLLKVVIGQIPMSFDSLSDDFSNPTRPGGTSPPSNTTLSPIPDMPSIPTPTIPTTPVSPTTTPAEEDIPLPPANGNYINLGKNDRTGEYITNDRGMALYSFELDTSTESKCTGACLEKWTPVYVRNVIFPPPVASGLNATLVGLFERDDGKYQASYNRLPLYLYRGDKRPSDIKGHKLKEFGGIWSLISPVGVQLDNRAQGLLKNLTNINTIHFSSTGLASIVILPDLFVLEMNITATDASLSAAVKNIEDRINNFNRLTNSKVTLTDKTIKQNGRTFTATNVYKISATDAQSFSKIINAAKQLSQDSIKLDFGVSEDLFYNTKSSLYELAVKDATENANNLLSTFSLEVDPKNPIRSITIDFVNLQTINPVLNSSTMTYLPAFDKETPNIATIQANINFNIKKK